MLIPGIKLVTLGNRGLLKQSDDMILERENVTGKRPTELAGTFVLLSTAHWEKLYGFA